MTCVVDDEDSESNESCFGNCFGKQPMYKTPEYNPNADVKETPISCRSEDSKLNYYIFSLVTFMIKAVP